jgi:hypothetical protein
VGGGVGDASRASSHGLGNGEAGGTMRSWNDWQMGSTMGPGVAGGACVAGGAVGVGAQGLQGLLPYRMDGRAALPSLYMRANSRLQDSCLTETPYHQHRSMVVFLICS